MEVGMIDDRTMDLFGEPPRRSSGSPKARKSDPLTSHTAALFLNIDKVEAEVCWAISMYPNGCIYDEVIALLPNRRVHSIQPRFAPLRRKRKIIALGKRVSSRTGRKQTVYIICKENNDNHSTGK
jgi:hypothetical protein